MDSNIYLHRYLHIDIKVYIKQVNLYGRAVIKSLNKTKKAKEAVTIGTLCISAATLSPEQHFKCRFVGAGAAVAVAVAVAGI